MDDGRDSVQDASWFWRTLGYLLVVLLATCAGVVYSAALAKGRLLEWREFWEAFSSPGLRWIAAIFLVMSMTLATLQYAALFENPAREFDDPIAQNLYQTLKKTRRTIWVFMMLSIGVAYVLFILIVGVANENRSFGWLLGGVFLGHYVPLVGYSWLVDRTSMAPETLLRMRFQAISPTLLATYLPFLVGASMVVVEDEPVVASIAVILAISEGAYFFCVMRIRDSRKFFGTCCALYIGGIATWAIADASNSFSLEHAANLHFFAMTMGLYMLAFEFLAVARRTVARQAGRSREELLQLINVFLVFFLLFPVTYLFGPLDGAFLALSILLAITFSVGWVTLADPRAIETFPSSRFKLFGYGIPLILIVGCFESMGNTLILIDAPLFLNAVIAALAFLAPGQLVNQFRIRNQSVRLFTIKAPWIALAAAVVIAVIQLGYERRYDDPEILARWNHLGIAYLLLAVLPAILAYVVAGDGGEPEDHIRRIGQP